MLNKSNKIGAAWYLLTSVFLLLNVFLLYKNFYFFAAVPIALLIAYFSFYNTKQLLYFVIFCTPFSLNLESVDLGTSIGFYLPTEPILFGLLILFTLKFLKTGTYDKAVVNHPISLAILFYLAWMLLTTITSSNPIVSLKFFISRLWFIIPMFFFIIGIFKDLKAIYLAIWLYLIPLSIVVFITLVRHQGYGFDQEIAHWIMSPFFKDHTSYGALVAFYIPLTFGLLMKKNNSPIVHGFLLLFLAILMVGLVYSFTRAAWVSLVGAIGVYLLFKLKIKFKYLAVFGLIVGGLAWQFQTEIKFALEKNKTDSSKSISKHIESISNVSTDASNLERINRWNCALEMFKNRPVFGWGPGTYVFEYAKFQHPDDLTIISTNFGDGGNAHSEYLGPLAETGLIGALSVILLLIVVFYKGSMLYINLQNNDLKWLVMSVILALVTYFTHGILNNYLDTDKASIPVWNAMAILVAVEVYHFKGNKSQEVI